MSIKNNWTSIGLIFKPNKKLYWMKSHCWVPFVEIINDNLVKVFFSSRDKNNFSRTGHFFFNPNKPFEKKKVDVKPDVDLGKLGTFDDSAAVSTCIVNRGNKKYLFYVGWMQGKRVRYYPSIGLSISKRGENKFKKKSFAPLIPKNNMEPYGLASPFVLYDTKNKIWKMWYSSYRSWEIRKKKSYPNYQIRYATSNNGIDWKFKDKKILGSKKFEAVARPFVIKENNFYKMWYCSREKNSEYKIHYAESKNGIKWKNKKFKLKLSKNKYDNRMQAYPCYFKIKNKEYLLYNGNDYGKKGILLAIKDD